MASRTSHLKEEKPNRTRLAIKDSDHPDFDMCFADCTRSLHCMAKTVNKYSNKFRLPFLGET